MKRFLMGSAVLGLFIQAVVFAAGPPPKPHTGDCYYFPGPGGGTWICFPD